MNKSYFGGWILCLSVVACMSSCHNKSQETPKFADWELDSLEVLPPTTPAETYETKGTEITQKWYITVFYRAEEVSESEIDPNLYLQFLPDNTFTLSIPKGMKPEVKEVIQKIFPENYMKSGQHTGKYACYDVEWCGCTCDGSYGVVLSDMDDEEFCRCAFIYMTADETQFTLRKVLLPDPQDDTIQTDIELKLHNKLD